MSTLIRLIAVGVAILMAPVGSAAYAQNGTVYAVTYVDIMPNATKSGAAVLRRYRDASRREDGNLGADVLKEVARPNRFAIVETWKEQAAAEVHDKAASSADLIEQMKTVGNAPIDRRLGNGLYGGLSSGVREPKALYVLTHVDVIPASKEGCVALLKAMSEDTPKDAGNTSYTVLQQANRGNHFMVFEVWANRKALNGHAEAAHTRAFREKLSPMAGALYDERFYKLVD